MSWLTKIFRSPAAKGIPDTSSSSTQDEVLNNQHDRAAAVKSKKLRPPSDHWTNHQIFYVFIMNGIGAFAISGGLEFAIAYGMYGNQDLARNPIRLWRLPNTLSGDAAVTIFIQSVITWLITMIMANGDLRNGKVQPIGFVPEPKNKFLRWYFFLDAEQPIGRKNFKQWITFILGQIGRALIFAIPLFFLVWPATVGILTSSTIGSHRGNDYYYNRRWTPQVYKLILGGIIGLLQTPFFAMAWLLTVGWREQRASTLPTTNHVESPGPVMTQVAHAPATTADPIMGDRV